MNRAWQEKYKINNVMYSKPLLPFTIMKKATKQKYMNNLNQFFVHRLEIGYNKDTVQQLEQQHISEDKHYEIRNKLCLEQAQNLEKFVAEDYKMSMDLLNASDQLKVKTESQSFQYLNIASKVYTIRCELNVLDARYRVLKQYHRFLFMLSPKHWREQFEETGLMEGSEISSNSEVQNYSFTNIANYVYNDLTLHSKPQLFFKSTIEIENVLTIMENYNYNQYCHLTQLSAQSKKLESCIRVIKENIQYEQSLIQGTMEYLERSIQYGLEKANGLRDIFFDRIHMHTNTFDLISSKKVFKLLTAVEYCYESIFGENCGSFSIIDMIKELEIDFLSNCRFFDSLDDKMTNQHVRYFLDTRQMKQALIAARELESLKILTKSMTRIMEPPAKPERSKKVRSYVPNPKKKIKKNVEQLTSMAPSDFQYLTLFTDWTKNDDPKTFLATKKYDYLFVN